MKKLHRSSTDKVAAGIIGGLGEYWNVDPVVLRLGFIFIVMITGLIPGILAYLVAMAIVPKSLHDTVHHDTTHQSESHPTHHE